MPLSPLRGLWCQEVGLKITWLWLSIMAVTWSENSQSQTLIGSFRLGTGNSAGSAQYMRSRHSFSDSNSCKYAVSLCQGPGAERPHLLRMAGAKGLSYRVTFVSHCHIWLPEVPLLRHLDLLVSFARYFRKVLILWNSFYFASEYSSVCFRLS